MSRTHSFRRVGVHAAVTTLSAALCTLPAVLAAQPAMGQPPMGGAMGQPPAGGRGGRMMEMLMDGITLTDAQKVKVDSMQAANRARMEARRSQMQSQGGPPDSATRATRRQEMMQEQETQRAAIRAMLTPDQQTRFDANVAHVREQMQQRMGQGGPGRP